MYRESMKVTVMSRWPLYKGDCYDRYNYYVVDFPGGIIIMYCSRVSKWNKYYGMYDFIIIIKFLCEIIILQIYDRNKYYIIEVPDVKGTQ
jgi:hypothetical protein